MLYTPICVIISQCCTHLCLFEPGVLVETVAQLIPDAGSPLHERVQQYRELLDGLPMDAYTHGCILHPELTTDSMIPKYATAEIRSKSSQNSVFDSGNTPFTIHEKYCCRICRT